MTPLEDRTVPATVAVALFATGVDADGAALGDDATDPHYELISNGGANLMPGAARTITADGFPISPWAGNDPGSRWIVPIATDGDGNAAVGTFAYRTTFDLTGIDPSTVSIAGQWAADNDATIVLNGVNTGVSMAAEDFQSLSAFSLSGGFRSGVNTLDFVVHNAGGPTGLRVAALTGSGEETDQVGVAGVAFNTGVDDAGYPLPATGDSAVIDPHWTVVDAPDASLLGATKVVPGDAYPFPVWVANDGNSQWIAPVGAGADASAPPGTYKYQTTFDLTGYDPATAVLSGRWSADNEGVNVYLNGVPLNLSVTGPNPGTGVEAFRGYADLYIANGVGGAVFQAGENTLTFEVRNDQLSSGNSAANPVGLRVDDLKVLANVAPPPGNVIFDLDVNSNGTLTDAVDLAANYLPGYEGDVAKLSTGSSFNAAVFEPQRMKLVLDGIGSATPNIAKVVFTMKPAEVSKLGGYASNRSHPSIEGVGTTDDDYSFKRNENWHDVTVTPTTTAGQDASGPFGGQMDATKTWVHFYAKDYGGSATVSAVITYTDGTTQRISLKIPLDMDNNGPGVPRGDGIADKWEYGMLNRWKAQYRDAAFDATNLRFFSPGDDKERRDPDGKEPDGSDGRLVPQKEEGDAHTVIEEYRGYVLDGGGVDGQGKNGHTGGHIRLDPARKEVLLEVDKAEVLNNVPGDGTADQNLRAMFNGTAQVFSNAERGAGIYVYWLVDDSNLDLPKDSVDEYAEHFAELKRNQNANLAGDFLHILLIDQGVSAAVTKAAGRPSTAPAVAHDGRGLELAQRGVVFATSDVPVFYTPTAFPNRLEAYSCILAHEITHLLIDTNNQNGFNGSEHTFDPQPGDGRGSPVDRTCLMFAGYEGPGPSRANREFATVRLFSVVQVQLKTKSGAGLAT